MRAQPSVPAGPWSRQRVDRPGFEQATHDCSRASWLSVVLLPVRIVWFLVALPFRVIFSVIALLGRLAGVVLGFGLMVLGMALGAGPLFFIGIPLFLVGLYVMLRSLD